MTHVFISYVRENQEWIDRLADDLRERGLEVWLDREQLQPGQRWQVAIRQAIREGAGFIACFSAAYAARTHSYMNEELTLAIEELRKHPLDRTWFIPVMLDSNPIPERPIGAGETIRDLHWVNLMEDWNDGVTRIVSALESCPSEVDRDNDPRQVQARRVERTPLAAGERTHVERLRSVAGELAERVGDYGAPLEGEEDELYRAKWRFVRESAGRLAHHAGLRQLIRDFDNRLGWMMLHKSEGVAGGRRMFGNAEAETDARSELTEAYESLASECNQILRAAQDSSWSLDADGRSLHEAESGGAQEPKRLLLPPQLRDSHLWLVSCVDPALPTTIDPLSDHLLDALHGISLPFYLSAPLTASPNRYHTRPTPRGVVHEDFRRLSEGVGFRIEILATGRMEFAVCLDELATRHTVDSLEKYPLRLAPGSPVLQECKSILPYFNLAKILLAELQGLWRLWGELQLGEVGLRLSVGLLGSDRLAVFVPAEAPWGNDVLSHPVQDPEIWIEQDLSVARSSEALSEACMPPLIRALGLILKKVFTPEGKLNAPIPLASLR